MRETLLTVAETASRLRCHPHTIRRWIWNGKLSAMKVGDLVRVPEQELAKLVRPTHAGQKQPRRRPKGPKALIATIQKLSKTVKPADVRLLERIIAEAEQTADWTHTIA